MTDGELIHDEIEKEISQCQCRNSFRAEMIDEGKYRVRFSFEERVSIGKGAVVCICTLREHLYQRIFILFFLLLMAAIKGH